MAAGDRTRSRELCRSTVHWAFRRRPRHRPRILESDPAGRASHAFRCLRSTNQDGPARRVVQAVLRIEDDHEPLRLAARNLSVMRRSGTVSAVSPRAWDDPAARVGDREAAEARALHVIADLVGGWPGITSRAVANQVASVLQATAIELGSGRPVPVAVRRAVRGLADALRREMEP